MTPPTSNPLSTQTLDQRRAQHAWGAVQNIKNTLEKKAQKHYQGEAKKMPVRIMTAGLGQALAFIVAKSKGTKSALGQLHIDLSDWVIVKRPMQASKDNLLESVVHGSSDFLQQATNETLAYLSWLNRFLEAELGEVDTPEGDR